MEGIVSAGELIYLPAAWKKYFLSVRLQTRNFEPVFWITWAVLCWDSQCKVNVPHAIETQDQTSAAFLVLQWLFLDFTATISVLHQLHLQEFMLILLFVRGDACMANASSWNSAAILHEASWPVTCWNVAKHRIQNIVGGGQVSWLRRIRHGFQIPLFRKLQHTRNQKHRTDSRVLTEYW